MPDNNYKAWVVARGTGRRIVFNGIIPHGMPFGFVKGCPKQIIFGKVPSTTYVDEDNKHKPIPTFWKFGFSLKADKDKFVFFLNGARTAFSPSLMSPPLSSVSRNKRNIKGDNTKTTKEKIKMLLKPDEKKGKKLIEQDENNILHIHDSSDDESSGSKTDTDEKKENMEKLHTDFSDFSISDEESLDSPVFAQSQDVYEGLCHWKEEIRPDGEKRIRTC